jgi:hypothetical protein
MKCRYISRIFFFALLLFLIASCKDKIRKETTVYTNDFERGSLANIENGFITVYNGSSVLGRYNNGYFNIKLNDLPQHDLITITFDLYIHDRWDGNKTAPDGPDIWQMWVDDKTYINTTFSNLDCPPGYFCSPQSYPFNYPNNYNSPKAGAYRTDLPGVCGIVGPNGTTQYKIEKTFVHTNNTLSLRCLDKLVQDNANDKKCDESWSVDNISIKAIIL